MEDSRRRPPPFPSLAVRERGNYISVRQGQQPGGGWGTLNRPKQIELPRLGQQRLHTRLGYEAMPSSEVWAFEAPFSMRLQVNRLSEDRMANCVAIALLDDGNRHVAPLVATARGVGEPVTVPAGAYRIIASLGIPEQVELEIEVNVSPPQGLQGLGLAAAGGRALLLAGERRGLQGRAVVAAGGRGRVTIAGQDLEAVATVVVGGTLLVRETLLTGGAVAAVSGRATLADCSPAPLTGVAAAVAGGRATLPPVVWLNQPDEFWRARRNGSVLELNRAYFADETELQRQQLAEAGL